MTEKALTITKHFACPLTESEKQDKHDELVRTINDLRRIEEHFAGIKEQHKANVKSREVKINELSQELGNGYVMRPSVKRLACEPVRLL